MVLLLVSRMDWFDMKDDNVGTSALFEGLLVFFFKVALVFVRA